MRSTNIPKFIVKEFRKYIQKYKYVYEGHENEFMRTKKILDKFLKEKREDYVNINFAKLKEIFGHDP